MVVGTCCLCVLCRPLALLGRGCTPILNTFPFRFCQQGISVAYTPVFFQGHLSLNILQKRKAKISPLAARNEIIGSKTSFICTIHTGRDLKYTEISWENRICHSIKVCMTIKVNELLSFSPYVSCTLVIQNINVAVFKAVEDTEQCKVYQKSSIELIHRNNFHSECVQNILPIGNGLCQGNVLSVVIS